MAKIYKLTCEDPELIYYGSTIGTLNHRLQGHIVDNKRSKNLSTKPLFEKGNLEIHLIEECSIEDRFEREDFYIKNNPCVNKQRPYTKERGEKESRKESMIKYYQNHKEKITKKQKEKITCECGASIQVGDYSKHKRTDKHLNFVNHGIKHKPSEEPKQTCECGSTILYRNKYRHIKSKKHQDYITNL